MNYKISKKVIFAFLSFAISFANFATAKSKKPNILIILTDDQGYADYSLSEFSQEDVKTPEMDKLLLDGARFTQAHTSGATCSPTRAGILSGNYQQRNGLYDTPDTRQGFDKNLKIAPEYFKELGYATAMIGKWHLGLTPEFNPANRGFDYFYGFLGHGGHSYFDLGPTGDKGAEYNGMKKNLDPINDQGYLTTRIGDEAVDFINKNNDNPFFMQVSFNAVHSPAEAPDEDVAKYNTGDKTRDILMAMIDHMDLNIGRITKALKDQGIYDNTLIFILTDNGGAPGMKADNTPLRGAKHSFWEGGHRTPFGIVWKDKIKAGTVIDAPIMSFDILPTSLKAVGLDIPKVIVDGQDLMPLVKGKVNSVHDELIWYNGHANYAVLKDGWKLVYDRVNRKSELETHLFYLPKDVSEENNIAASNPEKVAELTAIFKEWRTQMKPFNKKQQIKYEESMGLREPRKKKNKNNNDNNDKKKKKKNKKEND